MGMPEIELSQKTHPLKVLIADDDAPTRILLRAAITQWGYQVVEAKDGDEAWEIMMTPESPRLLILDWLMPGLDGITLCERCKKELDTHPYIILLTQVTGTTNIIKGLEAGADEFLSKPFNMAELRSRLFTGARIINYEEKLTKQNASLAMYVDNMTSLMSVALETIEQIYKIINDKEICINSKINPNHVTQLTHLQGSLQNIVDVINNIKDRAK